MRTTPPATIQPPPSAAATPATEGGERREAATLAFLLKRMRRRSDFPATAAHVAELRAHTREVDRAQVGEVANVILKDYALSTKVLKLVNSSFYGQYGGRISTISRAVVVLGIRQVQAAALSLLMFEHLGDQEQAQSLREAAGRSILSGMLSRSLAHEARIAEPEEAFVCTMLRRLGEYLAIYYLPEEYAAIRAAVQTGGEDEAAACRRVLGLDFAELGIGVAREWQLPNEIIHCMHPLPAGTLPEPRGERETLARLAAFGDELSALVVTAPGPERDAALAALEERFGRSLPMPRDGLATLVQQAVNDSREYAEIVGNGVKGCRTLSAASRWSSAGGHDDTERAADTDSGGTDAAEAPASRADERRDALLRGIGDVSTALLEGCALNDVLLMVLETLYRGMGLSHVLFCVRDRRAGRVAARFGLGADVDRLLTRFRFEAQQRSDPFAACVLDGHDLFHPESGHRAGELPVWYRELLRPACFAALPVVVSNVCIGLIYCDHESSAGALAGDHRNYLNTLRNQAALAIKQHR